MESRKIEKLRDWNRSEEEEEEEEESSTNSTMYIDEEEKQLASRRIEVEEEEDEDDDEQEEEEKTENEKDRQLLLKRIKYEHDNGMDFKEMWKDLTPFTQEILDKTLAYKGTLIHVISLFGKLSFLQTLCAIESRENVLKAWCNSRDANNRTPLHLCVMGLKGHQHSLKHRNSLEETLEDSIESKKEADDKRFNWIAYPTANLFSWALREIVNLFAYETHKRQRILSHLFITCLDENNECTFVLAIQHENLQVLECIYQLISDGIYHIPLLFFHQPFGKKRKNILQLVEDMRHGCLVKYEHNCRVKEVIKAVEKIYYLCKHKELDIQLKYEMQKQERLKQDQHIERQKQRIYELERENALLRSQLATIRA